MAKIKFSNGQTVNFNGTPTQQDVEEVAVKLGISSAPKSRMPILTKEGGGFGTSFGTAIKDVTVGGIKGVTEGLQGLGKLTMEGLTLGKADTTKYGFADETLKAKSRGEQVGKVIGFGADIASGFAATKTPQLISKGKQIYDASKKIKQAEKITETIAPAVSKTEAKLATKEGRFVEGRDPTLFRSGTPDKILPSQKTLNATETIIKRIPNASKMKPTELYKAVDSTITKTAEGLRPVMKQTPIEPKTIEKINSDWEALKQAQIKVADATEEANVLKLQKQFEERLMKAGNQTHDDLWQARIDYDNSIPDNVKRANTLSSESLQNKKEIWLQNRKILNDAFESSTKPEFKEMSNLYEAKNSLLSKAKVDKAKLSKLKQIAKDNPKTTTAILTILGIKGADLLGVDLGDLIKP